MGEKIVIDPQASVSGQVKQILPDNKDIRRTTKRGDQFANLGFHVWSYFAILLIGVLLLRVSPTGMTRISERILKNPLPLLTWGVVALFLTVPILILIAMTIIGIPLAVLLLVIFLTEIYLSKVFVGIALGQWLEVRLQPKKSNLYAKYTVGLALLYLLMIIPIIRFFVGFVTLLLGLGAIIETKRNYIFPGKNKG